MTNIEWAEDVWNPIAGCSDVSEGCRHCYARTMAKRLEAMGSAKYEGLTVLQGSKTVWTGKIAFDEKALLAPLKRKKPTRYFVNSMSDLFHPNVTDEMRDRIFAVMALCPQHTFMVLTKRPDRMRSYLTADGREDYVQQVITELYTGTCLVPLPRLSNGWGGLPLMNVWLGVSVEDDSQHARGWTLLKTPAAGRFISYEPALGFLNLNTWEFICRRWRRVPTIGVYFDLIIVGGESGPGARPCNLAAIRSVVKQCAAEGVACFVKQLGAVPEVPYYGDRDLKEWVYTHKYEVMEFGAPWVDDHPPGPEATLRVFLKDRKGGDMSEWPEDLRVRQLPPRLTRDEGVAAYARESTR